MRNVISPVVDETSKAIFAEGFLKAKAIEIGRIITDMNFDYTANSVLSGSTLPSLSNFPAYIANMLPNFDNIINYAPEDHDVFTTRTGGMISMTSYIPQAPLGMFSVVGLAMGLDKAKRNLEAGGKDAKGIAPRINYYQNGQKDIFTIRGTQTIEDLATDLLIGAYLKPEISGAVLGGSLGGVAGAVAGGVLGNKLFNIDGSILNKKIEIYEKFVRDNHRGGKLIIAGHSLGSLEMNLLIDKLKDLEVESVGFSHPVIAPNPKSTINYTFRNDPLFMNSNMDNHVVLDKPIQKNKKDLLKGGTISPQAYFDQFHSTRNYY